MVALIDCTDRCEASGGNPPQLVRPHLLPEHLTRVVVGHQELHGKESGTGRLLEAFQEAMLCKKIMEIGSEAWPGGSTIKKSLGYMPGQNKNCIALALYR
jgi:hypothetical protein